MSFHTVVAADWESTSDFVSAEGPSDMSEDVQGDAEGRDEHNVRHGEEEGRSKASDDVPSTQPRGASVIQRTGLALPWLQQHLDRRAKANG